MSDEQVLVVPTQFVNEVLDDAVKVTNDKDRAVGIVNQLLNSGMTTFMPREFAEKAPEFKQLIPYIVLVHDNQYFRYQRGKGGGEQRLHKKYSLGFGGHINQSDYDGSFRDTFYNGLQRELWEELQISIGDVRNYRITPAIDVINDNSDEVGEVHLGLVFAVVCTNPELKTHEADLGDAGWDSVENIMANKDKYESWSQILIERGL